MAISDTLIRPRARSQSRIARMLRVITSPFYRYRHAKIIHSVRVGLAMLTSILATTGINIPHGIWASVTLVIVIGGLQHHGNIRKKAAERALGTLLGALIGLTLIVVQAVSGFPPLTYVLMSIIASICGYYAIGRPGYVALLTAITMCIVAGHGDNVMDTGLWRTLNVMIGIVIALAFSFALPLHATYSWRYRLADNLRCCARIYTRVTSGEPFDADMHLEAFRQLSDRLVQLRGLMPSVAKEIDLPLSALDQIQRLHRSMLSALEMLSNAAGHDAQQPVRLALAARRPAVRAMLLATARALRFGSVQRTWSVADALRPLPRDGEAKAREAVVAAADSSVGPVAAADASQQAGTAAAVAAAIPVIGDAQQLPPEPAAGPLAPELQGPWWLALRFEEQVEELRARLFEIEPHWNIERRHAHWPG